MLQCLIALLAFSRLGAQTPTTGLPSLLEREGAPGCVHDAVLFAVASLYMGLV